MQRRQSNQSVMSVLVSTLPVWNLDRASAKNSARYEVHSQVEKGQKASRADLISASGKVPKRVHTLEAAYPLEITWPWVILNYRLSKQMFPCKQLV